MLEDPSLQLSAEVDLSDAGEGAQYVTCIQFQSIVTSAMNAFIGGSTVLPSNISPLAVPFTPQSSISIHVMKRSGKLVQLIIMPTSSACQLPV